MPNSARQKGVETSHHTFSPIKVLKKRHKTRKMKEEEKYEAKTDAVIVVVVGIVMVLYNGCSDTGMVVGLVVEGWW